MRSNSIASLVGEAKKIEKLIRTPQEPKVFEKSLENIYYSYFPTPTEVDPEHCLEVSHSMCKLP
jgi:hypothetical protein